MEKSFITAKEAREISKREKSTGFQSIMERVNEYALKGKKEFAINNKPLLKKWECELISLGYRIKIKDDDVWILSWDENEALPKPPLGLMPKYLHDEKRLDDIREAMGRWDNACKTIPQEWINEEKELLKAMKDRRNSTLANEEKFKNDAERFFHRSCDVMKIEIDKSAIYFQKGDEGFAFDAQYIFKKLAGL